MAATGLRVDWTHSSETGEDDAIQHKGVRRRARVLLGPAGGYMASGGWWDGEWTSASRWAHYQWLLNMFVRSERQQSVRANRCCWSVCGNVLLLPVGHAGQKYIMQRSGHRLSE